MRNDRDIEVEEGDEDYSAIRSIEQLSEKTISDIESFFITYLSAESKKVVLLPMPDAQRTEQILQMADYKKGSPGNRPIIFLRT